MKDYKRPPDLAAGIASISPVVGCAAGCAYCYIELEIMGCPSVNEYSIEQTIDFLCKMPSFRQGKQGTILCFGGWGEMFPSNAFLRQTSLNWISALAKLGNPMVLFTKASLTIKEIQQLKEFQLYDRQLLLLVTITCLAKYRELEPNTDSPIARLSSVKQWVASGLPAGILINPFLREYSMADYNNLISQLSAIQLVGVVISPLYLNDMLLAKIKRSRAMSSTYHRINTCGFTSASHMGNEQFRVYADEIEDIYPVLFQTAHAHGLSVWKHYLCLVMNYFHQFNADVFKKEPCIDCGHCNTILRSVCALESF